MDTDLRFVYINEWLARLNGLPVEAHLGKTIDEVLKDVAAGVAPKLRHVLETGEPIIEGTVEAETPAHPGESRRYMHNYYPDKSKDGTVVGVSCVVQDITERIALAT
jgi:PAS domain S-box-containing protein